MSSQTDREEEIVEERQRACGWLFTSLMYSYSICVTCSAHSMSSAGEDTHLLTQVAYTHMQIHIHALHSTHTNTHDSRSRKITGVGHAVVDRKETSRRDRVRARE